MQGGCKKNMLYNEKTGWTDAYSAFGTLCFRTQNIKPRKCLKKKLGRTGKFQKWLPETKTNKQTNHKTIHSVLSTIPLHLSTVGSLKVRQRRGLRRVSRQAKESKGGLLGGAEL